MRVLSTTAAGTVGPTATVGMPLAGTTQGPDVAAPMATETGSGVSALANSAVHASAATTQAAAGSSLLRVAQFNVWNLFDAHDDPDTRDMSFTPEQYQQRLTKVARYIKEHLNAPDVLSLNEIEGENVLRDLLATPELKDLGYKSIAGELNDSRGIRVGMIYRTDRVAVDKVEEFNPKVDIPGGQGQKDPSLLYARAPLAVDFRLTGAGQAANGVQSLTIVTNHFKSKLGGSFHEPRRVAQGELLGGWVDARRGAAPQTPIIVLGDFNALPEDGAYVKLTRGADGKERLYDAAIKVRKDQRYTYRYRGEKNLLDHLFVTPDLKPGIVNTTISHLNTPDDAKDHRFDPSRLEGTSDHDPIVTEFDLSKVGAASAER